MEISGDLSITLKVKSFDDLQRIMEICKQFDGQAIIRTPLANPRKRQLSPSKEETYQKILDQLKSAYPKEGFASNDAEGIALEKLGYGGTTAKTALRWAKNKGLLLKKGNGYFFVEFVKQRVAEKVQEMNPAESEAPMEAPLPQATS